MKVYTVTREYCDSNRNSCISTDVYSSREAAEEAMYDAAQADRDEDEGVNAVIDSYPTESGLYLELEKDEWIEYTISEIELK